MPFSGSLCDLLHYTLWLMVRVFKWLGKLPFCTSFGAQMRPKLRVFFSVALLLRTCLVIIFKFIFSPTSLHIVCNSFRISFNPPRLSETMTKTQLVCRAAQKILCDTQKPFCFISPLWRQSVLHFFNFISSVISIHSI